MKNIATLHLNKLGYSLQSGLATQDLTLSVPKGQCVVLTGKNGSGKTTLLTILAGLTRPPRGQVLINGYDLYQNPTQVQPLLGFAPEQPPIYPELTVNEYLRYVATLRRTPKTQLSQQVEKVSRLFNLTTVNHQLLIELSRGTRQRVNLAQAMIHEPSLLLLDEPTEGLDTEETEGLLNFLASYKQHNTVILSTHHWEEVKHLCDRQWKLTPQGIKEYDLHHSSA